MPIAWNPPGRIAASHRELHAFAKDSVVFLRAYAQVPLTTPSHAALLTGTYPQFNHIEDLGSPLHKDVSYLPDILRRQGYHTLASLDSIRTQSGAPGFDRGFDTYDGGFHKRSSGEDRYKSVERRAGDVVDHALSWLSKHPQGLFFIWLHFYDAHDPYDPPLPSKEICVYTVRRRDRIYGFSSWAFSDHAEVAQSIQRGIGGDRGGSWEAFGEHGEERHGMFLYDETVHVPLVLKLAKQGSAGKRVEDRVALADIAPTLLNAAGLAIPAAMQAHSLLKSGEPDAGGSASVYSETNYPHKAFNWSALRSWRAGKYLYVQAPKRELYDQSSDPGALHNLAESSLAVAGTLQSQLDSFHKKTESEKTENAKLDPAQAENLRALGYLASDSSDNSTSDATSGVDPKDKIQIANLMHQGLVDIEDDRYDEAIPKFEKVVTDEPNSPSGRLELGRALVHVKRYQDAIPVLQDAVAKSPDSGMAHFELGLAYVKTGQWEASLPEFQAANAKTPIPRSCIFMLAPCTLGLNRFPRPRKSLRRRSSWIRTIT